MRRDREKAPPALASALEYTEEHLFKAKLTVQEALAGAGVRDQNVAGSVARKHLGVTLKTYFRTRQVDTATAMRDDGFEAPTGETAAAVGLPRCATFCDWHVRTSGSRPVFFRWRATLEPDFNHATLNRALRGKLPADDARKLLERRHLDENASAPDVSPGTALERAREEALRKIRADAEGLPPHLQRVLKTLGDLLFQPVNVATILSRAGVTDTRTHHEFLFHLGDTPKAYLEKRLVEAAILVLGETKRKVTEVAKDVGVSCVRTFAAMFKRRIGERATDVRRLSPDHEGSVDPETWSRYGRGAATPEEAAKVRGLLERLVPTKTVILVDGAVLAERSHAEEKIWPALRDLSVDEAGEEVTRYVFVYAPTALSDLLRHKSREAGRRDPQLGVAWAEVALRSLEANAKALGERIYEEKARGWAWIGNAKRLALDFPGAETAFDETFNTLAGRDVSESVLGEVYDLKGSLRLFQRRHKESVALFSRSLEIFESVGDKPSQAKELMQRAAALNYDEQPESAALDLEKAVELVDAKSDVTLATDIYRDLAIVSAQSGRLEKALAAMANGERLMSTVEDPLLRYLFEWAKGFIEHCSGRYTSAKTKYLSALEGINELVQPFYGAFVGLDLAIVSSDLGQVDDAVRFSAEIIPFFDSLKLTSEAIAARRIARRASPRLSP